MTETQLLSFIAGIISGTQLSDEEIRIIVRLFRAMLKDGATISHRTKNGQFTPIIKIEAYIDLAETIESPK